MARFIEGSAVSTLLGSLFLSTAVAAPWSPHPAFADTGETTLSLHACENAGCLCQNHKHLSGVFNRSRVRVLVRPCHRRTRDQPDSRVDSTKVNERPQLGPSHHSHRFIEISDRVLTVPPRCCFKCHDNRRTKRMSVHERSPAAMKGVNLLGLLPATGALLARERKDLAASRG